MADRNIRNVTFLKIDLALKNNKNHDLCRVDQLCVPIRERFFCTSQEAVSKAEVSLLLPIIPL